MSTEFRYAGPLSTIEAGSPHFEGILMRYNSIGVGDFGKERFEPGAFGAVEQADVSLTIQHDRGRQVARTPQTMKIVDSNSLLAMVAKPPATQETLDARALVQAGVLGGLSIEFRAVEQRQENGIRVISRAELAGVSIVDRPAFPESVIEARRLENRAKLSVRLKGVIPYGTTSDCRCQTGNCKEVRILKDAFKGALETDEEILAIYGDYNKAVASRARGSLVLTDTPAGLEINASLPDNTSGRDLAAQAEVVPILTRPFFDQSASTFEEQGDVAVYSDMRLRAILIGPSDASRGWPHAELVEPPEARRAARRAGRWPIWL